MASSYSKGAAPAPAAPAQAPDTQTRTTGTSRLVIGLIFLVSLALIIPYIIKTTAPAPAQAVLNVPAAPIQPGQSGSTGNLPANAPSGGGFSLYALIFLVMIYVFVSIFLFARFGMGAIAYYKRISPLMWIITALVTAGVALRLIEGMQTLADILLVLAILAFFVVLVSEFSPELKKWWRDEKADKTETMKDQENSKEKNKG